MGFWAVTSPCNFLEDIISLNCLSTRGKPRQIWLETSQVLAWEESLLETRHFCPAASFVYNSPESERTVRGAGIRPTHFQLQWTNPSPPLSHPSTAAFPLPSSVLPLLQQVEHKPSAAVCSVLLPWAANFSSTSPSQGFGISHTHTVLMQYSCFPPLPLVRLQSLLPGSQLHCCLALCGIVFVPCLSGNCWGAEMHDLHPIHSGIITSTYWRHGTFCGSGLRIFRSCIKTGISDHQTRLCESHQTCKAHKDLRLV